MLLTMKKVSSILKDNIDNKNKSFNIDNSIDKGKYALKESFIPNTEDSVVARDIAAALGDCGNFAFYYSAVQKIGPETAMRLLSETKGDIEFWRNKNNPIKKPGALFNWKVQKFLKK